MTQTCWTRALVPRPGLPLLLIGAALGLSLGASVGHAQPAVEVDAALRSFDSSPGLLAITRDRLQAPFRRKGLVVLGLGVVGSTLGEDLESPEHETRFLEFAPLEPVSDLGNVYGAGQTVLGAGLALWSLGRWRDSERLRAAGRDLTGTLLAAGALTTALKLAFRARRPNGGPYSFPSGHTTVAFATAAVLQRNFGNRMGVAAYTLATFTAGARMEDNRHYFRDVVFGAALGMAVGGVQLPGGLPGRLARHVQFGGRGLALSLAF